jgi:hypothetical protein
VKLEILGIQALVEQLLADQGHRIGHGPDEIRIFINHIDIRQRWEATIRGDGEKFAAPCRLIDRTLGMQVSLRKRGRIYRIENAT